MITEQMKQFNEELLEEIREYKEAAKCGTEDAFTNVFASYVIDAGESFMANCNILSYKKDFEKAKVNGYVYDEYFQTLTLLVSVFENRVEVSRMGKGDIIKYLRQATKFYRMCKLGYFDDVEEIDPGYIICDYIKQYERSIENLKIILLTNKETAPDIPQSIKIDNISVKFDVWDLERLCQYLYQKKTHEDLVIRFQNKYNYPLKMIKVKPDNSIYDCYIGVISGQCLAEIYRDEGQKLIEKNVRSYLQATGKINKGLKSTLANESEMFMTYNNGISTTAKSILIDEETSDDTFVTINEIVDWQIVNGGQTTASIYNALQSNIDISNVNVQMKLTVIRNQDKAEEMIGYISKYANSQNKINMSDFSANDSYHIEMERLSRKIYVPSEEGKSTLRWYYERARGQYMVDVNRQPTPATKKKFKEQNPKSMCISKTVAAKCIMAWMKYPDIVSKGLETNFIEFSSMIRKRDIDKPKEEAYISMISKVILFKECDKIVSKQNFGGYKAQLNYYTIALLSEFYHDKVDDNEIWKRQAITPELAVLLEDLVFKVWNHFMNPEVKGINITQWCKKVDCWNLLKTRYKNKLI
ncbi:AIPR family protein [Petroclostridium sp. X23]|uniref:AIPR family protein n=1 Tax=Petroclostridium sp. X23 TaxID=3045146 RepID=UPI0024AE7959|nr:AIPR family protein [Petroclostridium sp. X23]WHH57175.1 AIPR family protein [Petroclostridium sp. X23]